MVDVTASWEVGERLNLNLTRSLESGGGLTLAYSETPVTIEVLEVVEDGYVLAWEYGRPDLSRAPPEPGTEELVDGLLDLSAMTVEYQTDASGTVSHFLNVDEVQEREDAIAEYFEGALSELFGGYPLTDWESQTVQLMPRSYSPLTNRGVFFDSVVVYHSVYGYLLDRDGDVSIPIELPNVWGGDPFPATQRAVASANGSCAFITIWVKPDPDRFQEILIESLADLALEHGLSPEDLEAEASSLSLSRSAAFRWDPTSTWNVWVRGERRSIDAYRNHWYWTVIRVAD